jgi:hypothetical protein
MRVHGKSYLFQMRQIIVSNEPRGKPRDLGDSGLGSSLLSAVFGSLTGKNRIRIRGAARKLLKNKEKTPHSRRVEMGAAREMPRRHVSDPTVARQRCHGGCG